MPIDALSHWRFALRFRLRWRNASHARSSISGERLRPDQTAPMTKPTQKTIQTTIRLSTMTASPLDGLQIQHFLIQTTCGDLAVALLDLYPDGAVSELFGGDNGSAASHERIKK